MMMEYADTWFLCSLYAPDAHTAKAAAAMWRMKSELAVVWIHQLEFRNALRLRVFRKEITPAQRDASLNLLLADLALGVLAHADASHGELIILDITASRDCRLDPQDCRGNLNRDPFFACPEKSSI